LFWLLLIVFSGAGFVFKLLWGFCVVWLGATIGTMIIHIAISENIRLFQITDAQTYHQLNNGEIILKRGSGLTLAFFLGRTALRGWVEKQVTKRNYRIHSFLLNHVSKVSIIYPPKII
jgi:uncharacterized membrane protein YdjX (TVP38/TMEM64 family)